MEYLDILTDKGIYTGKVATKKCHENGEKKCVQKI